MINRFVNNNFTWLDVESPTIDEAKKIMAEFDIDASIAQEILLPTIRPKVEILNGSVFLVMHFPALKHSHKKGPHQELDIILGKNFIITVRYDHIDSVHKFSKIFELKSMIEKNNVNKPVGYFFYVLMKEMYSALIDELSIIESNLQEIEKKIFNNEEKDMVFALSNVKRDLLVFKKATGLHKEVLMTLDRGGKESLEQNLLYYVRAVIGEYYKVENSLRNACEITDELKDTNASMLQTKENEIMKNFTVLAFITFPLSLIVSILTLTGYKPFSQTGNDFWILISLTVAIVIFLLIYFKHKKWL